MRALSGRERSVFAGDPKTNPRQLVQIFRKNAIALRILFETLTIQSISPRKPEISLSKKSGSENKAL